MAWNNNKVSQYLDDTNLPRLVGGYNTSWSAPSSSTLTVKATAKSPEDSYAPSSSSYSASRTASSTFSRPLKTASTVGSTMPSVRSTFTDQFQRMNVNEIDLPCTETELLRCRIVYTAEQFEDWYDHSLSHFGSHRPPKHTICIFCTATFESENRLDSWRDRMEHIADHFIEDGLRIESSLPDFNVVKYFRKKGLISQRDYDHAIEGSERPPCDGLHPYGWIPDDRREQQEADARRENSIPVKESRHRHRDGSKSKHKHKSSSSKTKPTVKNG